MKKNIREARGRGGDCHLNVIRAIWEQGLKIKQWISESSETTDLSAKNWG